MKTSVPKQYGKYFGVNVSWGLWFENSDSSTQDRLLSPFRTRIGGIGYPNGQRIERLNKFRLPILGTFSDLASAIGIEQGELQWLCSHRELSQYTHYLNRSIPKKGGGSRQLKVPKEKLRNVQYWILNNILRKVPANGAAKAYMPGASIRKNAESHVGQDWVIRVDLQDFFTQITQPRIKGMLLSFGYNSGVSTVLSLLCTAQETDEVVYDRVKYYVGRGPRFLPQGACTSPYISNLICRNLDSRLSEWAKDNEINYTRYSDDLIFSSRVDSKWGKESEVASSSKSGEMGSKVRRAPLSNVDMATKPDRIRVGELLRYVSTVIKQEGFRVKYKKTKVMLQNHRQMVTGVTVNSILRIPRPFFRKLRAFIHQVETSHLNRYAVNYLRGILSYIRVVSDSQFERIVGGHSWIYSQIQLPLEDFGKCSRFLVFRHVSDGILVSMVSPFDLGGSSGPEDSWFAWSCLRCRVVEYAQYDRGSLLPVIKSIKDPRLRNL